MLRDVRPGASARLPPWHPADGSSPAPACASCVRLPFVTTLRSLSTGRSLGFRRGIQPRQDALEMLTNQLVALACRFLERRSVEDVDDAPPIGDCAAVLKPIGDPRHVGPSGAE